MPWPSEQRQKTRKRILRSAGRLFSTRGFDRVAIGDVMKDAQLTHGAFYNHFGSKQELYAAAIDMAARESMLAKAAHESDSTGLPLNALLAGYLDLTHVRQEQPPCPLAFLATDVANREKDVRKAYTRVYKRLTAIINRQLPRDLRDRRSRVMALTALMIGGVAVSRALDDERTVELLLDACKEFGGQLLQSNAEAEDS